MEKESGWENGREGEKEKEHKRERQILLFKDLFNSNHFSFLKELAQKLVLDDISLDWFNLLPNAFVYNTIFLVAFVLGKEIDDYFGHHINLSSCNIQTFYGYHICLSRL